MIPVISKHRIESVDGLWTTKMGGSFDEGDSAQTSFFYEGRADIKELGGHLKLFIKDLAVLQRPLVVTEQLKVKLLAEYREDRKKKKLAYASKSDQGTTVRAGEDENVNIDNYSASSDEEDDEEKEDRERAALESLIDKEKRKPLTMPKITLFLTKKKPKTRMVDAHTNGTKVRISGVPEGELGLPDQLLTYEAVLTDIPSVLQYQGLVALKMPADEPMTDEPVIYGIVKLQSFRQLRIRTRDALQLSEISESLAKILVDKHSRGDNRGSKDGSNGTKSVPPGKSSQLDFDDERVGEGKGAGENVKPLHVYRSMASKVWINFQKAADEEIDFETCLQFLDYLGIFMVTIQASRIFSAVDLKKNGKIGISEFENFLIARDILSGYSTNLIVLDVFDTLKSLPVNEVFQSQQQADKSTESVVRGSSASTNSLPISSSVSAAPRQAAAVDKTAADVGGQHDGDGEGESKGDEKGKRRGKSEGRPVRVRLAGLDYTAFCEAVQMLGLKDIDPDAQEQLLTEAFCFGGGFKAKDAERQLLNLQQFRAAWLRIADLEQEMRRRMLKFDSGVFAEGRNRERLSRALLEVESAYLATVARIGDVVERVKQDRRRRKDEKRRAQEVHREKLLHEVGALPACPALSNYQSPSL